MYVFSVFPWVFLVFVVFLCLYKVQSMPYKSLPLGAFWTIFGRIFPTGVPELLYPYQPANPLVESIFKALKFSKKIKKHKISSYIWATERIVI